MPPSQTTPPGLNKHCKLVETPFIAGYNANKGVYTREDVVKILNNAYQKKALSNTYMDVFIDNVIDEFRQLSLPKSLKINDNNEIIEIVWT